MANGLDTYYADRFTKTEHGQPQRCMCSDSPNRASTPIMEYVERTYPGVRSYSLPSVGWQNADGTAVKPHIEFGIKAEGEACRDLDKAWDEVLQRLQKLGAELKDRAG